ncbi:GNAT family N-acetyltransferase [Roseibium sediminicola]|uniref:GNAT family N-acetyltransferase n=1 Tax=Roseibium sediminicola TaxID=2933272 RepID=A0ABT0GN43_9HYPH|nr:N-acetyltransferase [Roseibium sp. CAU 1639]MCK7610846.1 GNAT family N-acetyltransferase [Roseibium sp. CAU 1639]
MTEITIKQAERDDAARLHHALTRLSADMGDTHAASLDTLLRHGFSQTPAFFALLATRGEQTVGALVASPVFSTTRGGAGLYVSDLWVAAEARGAGLGPRLLAAALDHAPESWTVTFLKLAVYHDNPDARRFYERLGFEPRQDETVFDLQGPALDNLRKRP